jgi:GNAT superfamily N-acetyltransferase
MNLEVRQAKLSDHEAIEAFPATAYEDGSKGGERWTQFACNPFGDRSDGLAPAWIALDHGRVVGQIAVQEVAFQIQDRTYKAGWIVDVMILPSHRGLGVGRSLHEDIPARTPLVATLTMAPATRRSGVSRNSSASCASRTRSWPRSGRQPER